MEERNFIAYLIFLSSFALILTTCGGGGGPSDTIAPSVSSTSPADATTGVATDSVITATFNEQMDASTIDATTFAVSRGGSNFTGTVTYDSGTRTATFTPSGFFALKRQYTATITTGVRDLAGNALSANYAWSFTSRDGTWGAAALIETDNAGDAWVPQVAMDSRGNAIAVWYQFDGTLNNIWANRYVAGTGWGAAEFIEKGNAGDARFPRIAMDSSGSAIAVWGQLDGTRINIWANRFN